MRTAASRSDITFKAAIIAAAALLCGAVLLALTRADALLLDLAALGICF